LLASGQWFFSASSITKTGRHDIAEILLKMALNAGDHGLFRPFVFGPLFTSKTNIPFWYLQTFLNIPNISDIID
jgi:hypothetical protein